MSAEEQELIRPFVFTIIEDSKADFHEFNRRLDEIGFEKKPNFPWIHLHSLANDESLSKFRTLMECLIERLRKF